MGTKLRFIPLLLGVFFFAPFLAHAYVPTGDDLYSSTVDTGTTFSITWPSITPLVGCGSNPPGFNHCFGWRITDTSGAVLSNNPSNNSAEINNPWSVSYSNLTIGSTLPNGSYFLEVMSCPGENLSSCAGFPSGTGPTVYYLKYDITGGSPDPVVPTVPPIGDTNEVVRYWPSFNYATSTGTTTVGVQFSIAHPEWIEGVGFELGGAPDTGASSTINYVNTLYTATTTVATPQTFSLTTDYNFTSGGYYTIQAFFIQNGRRVYNNTQATLLINYVPPNITIGNDGQFHFNGTTTVATSTLDALHIDCGDTIIVSSICKLAVSFFIPDPSAIQQVKDSFAALLTRAPFSFFTESRNVLGGVQGTAGADRNFSVNLFGNTTNIISASTTAAIGLGEDERDFMKFLMTIGLWILFAWFLYWRIASIFGV